MEKKLVVITGASSGIGRATAKRFSKLGHPMLLLGRKLENIDQYENTITKSLDVANTEAVETAIKEAEAKYGKTEILINSAGIGLPDEFRSQDPKEWKKMIDVNVMGTLNTIHCVINDMAARQSGTIVNLSSLSGRRSVANFAVYSGTKHAVQAISEGLRQEFSDKLVRVIVVSPGLVDTNMISSLPEGKTKEDFIAFRDDILGGGLEADDIADAIEYVCSLPQRICIREIMVTPTKQKS